MKRIGFLGLLLVSGAAFAGVDGSAFIDFERGWVFPQELGWLKYDASEKYEESSLGYSVFYRENKSSFRAEVSVYDLGLGSIPDGWGGEAVAGVLKNVKTELEWKSKNGKIKKLRKRGGVVVPRKGVVRFASSIFQYTEEGGATPVFRATYVTALQNHFVQLRLTFDLADAGKAEKVADRMVGQLAKLLTNPPDAQALLLASCSVLLNDPSCHSGRLAAKYLMAKAQTMDNLSVYTHLFVWPTDYYSKPKNADLLIAAYFAGMLQVVVPQQLDCGGEFEAFSAMLDAYEILRAKEQIGDIPKIGEWAKHSDRRALYDELLVEEE